MKNRIVAGIDVGTSKVTTIVASVPLEGLINIIGVATIPSRGIRKGQVVDIEEATGSILECLEAAERMAGYSISSAYFSVGGVHIASQNSHGVVAVAEPDKEITHEDVKRAVEAAKAISLPSTREILHVLPREFIVDSQEGIKDPLGMTGVRLEVETHLVTAGSTALRNLGKCASVVGVDVDGFVFSGLASAESSLTETEKELGVVLVDIGGGTTDICVYTEGALSYSSVLPIGAKNITNDLAIGLRISLESAEKIKLLLGKKQKEPALPDLAFEHTGKKEKPKDSDEMDIADLALPEGVTHVSRKTLVEGIIKPRLNEIFTMVGLEIKKSGFGGMTPAGLVLTGGGADTVGVVEAAKRNLAMPVRAGLPTGITGLIDEIIVPSYTAAIGLILYAGKSTATPERVSMKSFGKFTAKIPIKGVAAKMVDLVKSFLP
ncbi:MAG: Cell division protein ftsA [Candidatus Gottesmanbacteria bacterium GW2011_GWC2_39_8]|uniref:Cell division protein FtsA n=1 Tax=Candidatus Gottesmanbacteria bacterium GW2011_GWC2_39_8 TaxID=1618450 RepID=A0A0G0QAT8_9BACT|nr:MAG: Cell division protein ftsA [Candidatus Gottesmanbacteria bacterium GW2011_GWC2_39_8]